MIVETVSEFAEEILRPAARDADAAATYPADLIAKAAELGITAINVPEDFDGIAEHRSTVTNALVAEALAYGDMGLALPILAPAGRLGAHPLGQRRPAGHLSRRVRRPECAAGVCRDRRTARTVRPDRTADHRGAHAERLPPRRGQSLVPAAADAELFIVAAQLNGRPALFIVEADTAGLTVKADPSMGIRAAALGQVELDKVSVPLSARLGEDDASDADYSEAIALSRLGWAALAVGTSHAVLDYVIPYVKERKPSASRRPPPGRGVHVRQHRHRTRRPAADHLARRGPRRTRPAVRAGGRAGQKLGTDKGMQIGLDGVQLLGGHGYTKGAPGRTLVPRSAGHRRRRGCSGPLNPCERKSFDGNQSGNARASWKPSSRRPIRAPRRCCARSHASTTWPSTPTRSSSTPWPRCSRASRRPTPSRSPAPRRSARQRPGAEGKHQRRQHVRVAQRAGDRLG